jgi:hypothetical protein
MLDATQARDLILEEVTRSLLRVTVSKDGRGHCAACCRPSRRRALRSARLLWTRRFATFDMIGTKEALTQGAEQIGLMESDAVDPPAMNTTQCPRGVTLDRVRYLDTAVASAPRSSNISRAPCQASRLFRCQHATK